MEVVIRPSKSWLNIDLKGIWQYRDLLYLLVWRDFTAKYRQTILGPIWFIIQPLLSTLVFTIVFGKIAGLPTNGLPPLLFYLCNQIAWGFFSSNYNSASATFGNNAHLFTKVYFPRLVVPLSNVISNCFPLIIQIVTFIAFFIYFTASNPSASSFSARDVANPAGLAARLAQPKAAAAALLDGKISDASRQALREWNTASPAPLALKAGLAEDLNVLVKGPSIWDAQRFSEIKLRPETAALREKNPQGEDLARLNRLLIEDAFPELTRHARFGLTATAFLLPLVFLHLAIIGLGFGLWMSALTAKYRDLTQLSGILVQLWMYASPVILSFSEMQSKFPDKWKWLVSLNPVSFPIETIRLALLGSGTVTLEQAVMSIGMTVFFLITGLMLFTKVERIYVDLA
jgi:ABC-type polysaccharide/polyol phosphate export permease